MTIDDVKQVFQQFARFIEPVSKLSYDDNNKEVLCDLSEQAYNYDAIVGSLFRGQDVFKSFDAISFSKDGYVNFIEFKNAKIDKKQQDGIRGKVAEGILSFSTLAPYRPFIGNRYDEKWKYVDTALSLNEIEFMQRKDEFL